MASGTKFSFFVLKCVLACKGPREEASTALFPLPLPLGDVWSSALRRLSGTRRAKIAVRRSLFLAVAALNFLHFKEPFSQIKFLQRCPSECHLQIFGRLIALIKAGGHSGDFDVLSCGRKSHQLVARIEELHKTLQSFGLEISSVYSKEKVAQRVVMNNEKDELRPYRSLDASRLKLVGQASWDCRPFLSDLLL